MCAASVRPVGGDARRGVLESAIRYALLKLSAKQDNPRSFRPHILVFIDDIEQRLPLVHLASWFSQERGIVTAAKLVVGDLSTTTRQVSAEMELLKKSLRGANQFVFPEVIATTDKMNGILAVAQANGIAGLKPNTIMVGWTNNRQRLLDFFKLERQLEQLQQSFIITKLDDDSLVNTPTTQKKQIHLWWGGRESNSELMLLLAHLLAQNPEWRYAKITINTITANAMSRGTTTRFLNNLLAEIRIEAQINVLVRPGDEDIADIIHQESQNADIVFMGLAKVDEGQEENYAQRLEKLAGPLKSVVFVKNSAMHLGELVTDSIFSST